jgi:hypothetical protein
MVMLCAAFFGCVYWFGIWRVVAVGFLCYTLAMWALLWGFFYHRAPQLTVGLTALGTQALIFVSVGACGLHRSIETSRRTQVLNNLRTLGLVFQEQQEIDPNGRSIYPMAPQAPSTYQAEKSWSHLLPRYEAPDTASGDDTGAAAHTLEQFGTGTLPDAWP